MPRDLAGPVPVRTSDNAAIAGQLAADIHEMEIQLEIRRSVAVGRSALATIYGTPRGDLSAAEYEPERPGFLPCNSMQGG